MSQDEEWSLYNFDTLSTEMLEFIDGFKSLIISSDLGENCIVSYAPFVRENDEVYILVSSVARHYKAIQHSPNKVQIIFLPNKNDFISKFEKNLPMKFSFWWSSKWKIFISFVSK